MYNTYVLYIVYLKKKWLNDNTKTHIFPFDSNSNKVNLILLVFFHYPSINASLIDGSKLSRFVLVCDEK